MNPRQLTLEGRFVRLEPLNFDHADAFLGAGAECGLTNEFVQEIIAALLRTSYQGRAIPFATVDRASGKVAGGTAFLQIDSSPRISRSLSESAA